MLNKRSGMNRCVHHDQAGSGGQPSFALWVSSEQKPGEGHRDDLGSETVNCSKWLQESLSHPVTSAVLRRDWTNGGSVLASDAGRRRKKRQNSGWPTSWVVQAVQVGLQSESSPVEAVHKVVQLVLAQDH